MPCGLSLNMRSRSFLSISSVVLSAKRPAICTDEPADIFTEVLAISFALQLLGLATPLFFQVIVDKVLVHQSASTLWVLAFGICIALVFEAAFAYTRQILLLAATNKIDMQITRRAFGHLLSLPIDFFETATAGVIARQMQQLQRIRHFLTGRVLFAALVQNPHALRIHQAIWRALGQLQYPSSLVDRYRELTEHAVFYLDPHVCMRCRYRSTELLWQCPHCHDWNTFVEERIAPAKDHAEVEV